VLGVVPEKPRPASPESNAIGFYDRRYGISFSTGFEIFRTYLGREYHARAIELQWQRLDNGEVYPSLNQLSRSLGARENAWDGWMYLSETGEKKPIAKLRDPTKIPLRLMRSTNESLEKLRL